MTNGTLTTAAHPYTVSAYPPGADDFVTCGPFLDLRVALTFAQTLLAAGYSCGINGGQTDDRSRWGLGTRFDYATVTATTTVDELLSEDEDDDADDRLTYAREMGHIDYAG